MYEKYCRRLWVAWIPTIGVFLLASSALGVLDSGGAESESGFITDRSGEPTDTAGFAPSKEIVGGVLEHLRPKGGKAFVPSFTEADIEALPDSFSYRDMPPVIPVRNQGACGACWAFSMASVAEKQIALVDNQVLDISEQWILDCNTNDFDCGAGWCPYQMLTGPDACGKTGLVLESDAPYAAVKLECDCELPRTPVYDFTYVGAIEGDPGAEEHINAIKEALWKYGPLWSTVYSSDSFSVYKGDIYNVQPPADVSINKSIVIEGWDDTQGDKGVWIIRNTYGPDWGDKGYAWIEYGVSLVGTYVEVIQYKGETSMHNEATIIEHEGEALEEEGEVVERPSLALHPLTSFEIGASGGEARFEIVTTADTSVTMENIQWATFSLVITPGSNDVVTITCQENVAEAPRTATITVTGTGTQPGAARLVLTQLGAEPGCGCRGQKSLPDLVRDVFADWLLVGLALFVLSGMKGRLR